MTILTTGGLLVVAAVLALNVAGWARRGFRRDRRRSTLGTSSSVNTDWWTYSDGSSSGSSDWSSSDGGSSSSDCGSS